MIAVAIMMPVLVFAQEQQANEQPKTKAAENAPNYSKPPLAVTVVGPITFDAGKTVEPNWNEPNCAAVQNHNEADLCQQIRMARAAEDTYYWTKWAALIATVGTAFLVWNLIEARKASEAALRAANAASESNKIAEAQIRAYLAEERIEFEWAKTGPSQVTAISSKWINNGTSPALGCNLKSLISCVPIAEFGKPIPQSIEALERQPLGSFAITIGGSKLVEGASLSPEETAQWLAGNCQLVIHNLATYRDFFGKIWKVETCQSAHHVIRDGNAFVRFKVYPHHNRTNYSPET